MSHKATHQFSITQPEKFWQKQAQELTWNKFPKTILSKNKLGFYHWFEDGEINMSYLCLDYHIENGRGNQIALIYDSPVSNTVQKYTYNELKTEVAKFAGGLSSLGITKGDTVIIYMPMIPQAIISMLACARIGAIHSVVFGGFASHELAVRIDDCKPKAIVTATYGIEIDRVLSYTPLVKNAIEESEYKPPYTIVYNRKQHEDVNELNDSIDFETLKNNSQEINCVFLKSTDPLYILYTSGTTGKPKGVLRDHGGYATALKFSMSHFYDAQPSDVFFAASDLGWVVGHSFITYGPLIQGCTTVLYEGKPIKTPDAGAFWRLIEEYKVKIMFTAPTAIRAIKKEDPDALFLKKYNISSLKTLFLAGERCDITTYNWIVDLLNRPVIDHWWQTESGWPMLGIMTGVEPLPAKAGSAGLPVCGYDIQILDEDGKYVDDGKEGLISIKLPLPPGCLNTLWNNDARFKNGYLTQFEGYYTTGDGGYKDTDGYFFVMGRVDDVINVAGHRLSTGEMEEIISTHHSIAECAVVGMNDELKGQVPLAFVVLKDWQLISEIDLEKELVTLIRNKIGAIACLKNVVVVKRLPKTRSGKILRKTLRSMADFSEIIIPSTIEDITVLDEINDKLKIYVLNK